MAEPLRNRDPYGLLLEARTDNEFPTQQVLDLLLGVAAPSERDPGVELRPTERMKGARVAGPPCSIFASAPKVKGRVSFSNMGNPRPTLPKAGMENLDRTGRRDSPTTIQLFGWVKLHSSHEGHASVREWVLPRG
ncbi:hypothetical protein VNO77_22967 [Canavalia gladiata]|uniref:Uncharacterized protein n=1 Tax=Canavalia gladiata TaxID=3824 RepID=A0AAN9L522_CANGL